MKKQAQLCSGKSKTLYSTDDARYLIIEFRDDITAFNAGKKASLSRKGFVNNHFSAFILQKLAASGVASHFERIFSDKESVVKRLEMLPVECVVRNVAAGSICKRLGLAQGLVFPEPIFEFFYKKDALNDPMINDSHIEVLGWATKEQIAQMKACALRVNQVLYPLFAQSGMLLVDYKVEFGMFEGELLLGDEFTPDGCRIWDQNTQEVLDKDRFRKDMGSVIEFYELAAQRLGVLLPAALSS